MTKRQHHTTFIIVILLVTLGLSSTDLYTPSLPFIAGALHTNSMMVKLTVTLFLIGLGVSQLIYGPLSDRFGRRPIYLVAIGIYIIGSLLCVISHSIDLLLIGRLVQGLGAGVMLLGRTITRDLYHGTTLAKMASYIAITVSLAIAVAPIAGGLLQHAFNYRANFLVLFLLGLILLVFGYFGLHETNQHRHLHQKPILHLYKNYLELLKSRIFMTNALMTGICMSIMISVSTINPYLIESGLGYTAAMYGLFAAIGVLGFFVGMYSNARLVEKYSLISMIRFGVALGLFAALLMLAFAWWLPMSVATIMIPTFLLTTAISFIFPNVLSRAFEPFGHIAGSAAAMFGGLQIIISTLSSIVVAMLHIHTLLIYAYLMLGLAVINTIFKHFSVAKADKIP